jgi:anaerobic selenocysteine-containing dehydrogenase
MLLEGDVETDDGAFKTSFTLIKAAMAEYTPEWAEEKSTVPAATIRRIAGEFVSHAHIGATININGTEFPLRPVSIVAQRGSINHQDGTVLDLATKVLNELVGAMDVPGGCMGCNRGPILAPDENGTVTPVREAIGVPFEHPPMSADLSQYFPYRHSMPYLAYKVAHEPEKYGLPYNIEGALIIGGNSVLGSVEPNKMAEAMASIPFVATIAYNYDEVAALADVVLPEHAMLERMVVNVYETTFGGFGSDTLGLKMAMFRDPVPPTYNTRQSQDIVIELFKRMGLTGPMFGVMNAIGVMLGELTFAQLPDSVKLDPAQDYAYADILDRALKGLAGEDHGVEWFSENGLWIEKTPLEQCYNYYYFPGSATRYQIYFEGLRASGETLRNNLESNNVSIPEVNFDDMFAYYDPITRWRDTWLHKGDPNFDLLAFNFKIPNANFRLGGQDQLQWLTEVGDKVDPYYDVVCLNPTTAAAKGLNEGQEVWVESQFGKIRGRVKVSQLFHPNAVGIGGALGRMVNTLGKLPAQRLHYNQLMGAPLNSIDPIAGGTENTIRVKVYAA